MVEELLGNSVAAQLLNELMPDKSIEQWSLWLQNNRNQSRRASYRIPFEKMGGGVFYLREEIAKFAELEKSRKLGSIKLTGRAAEALQAYGIGTEGGSTTGRRFDVSDVMPQVDQATGKPYIQIITSNPLMVYRLELEEAKAFSKELEDAIGVCVRVSK